MKKFLSLFLITSLWVNAFAQGDPAPYVKGQNQSGLGNVSSTIVVPNQQSTKINSYQSRLETGNANVLIDPNFEGATTAWSAYADAAGASPVDCTGGSPTVSVSNSTTTPLEGNKSLVTVKTAVNSQGNGYSVPFTINASGQGMVQRINFDYKILSGTYASGDVTFWVYDVTNGILIQPSGNSLLNSSITESKEQLEFQASINSRSYRLCAHVSTTSASAYSLQFDNFSLGRTNKSYGSPTLGAVPVAMTSNFTNSTTTAWMTRSGDRAYFEGIVLQSGAPATADLILTLPSGMVIDSLKLPATNIRANLGSGWIFDQSAGTTFDAMVRGETTTSVRMYRFVNATPGQTAPVDQANPTTFASSDSIYFKFDVPIVGWSSQTVMSSDADTRVVAMIAGGNPANTSANGIIIYPTVSRDTHGSYNSTTGEYTVPVSGYYRVSASIYGSFTTGVLLTAVNGSARFPAMGFNFSNGRSSGSTVVFANAGDKITVYNTVALSSLSSYNGLTIERVSGPSQIAASESVSARYTQTSGQSIANVDVVIVNYANKIWDSHGAVTTGASWKFTAPMAGQYRFCYGVEYASASFTQGNSLLSYFFKQGVEYSAPPGFIVPVTGTNSWSPYPICSTLKLLSGEYADLRLYQNSGGARSLSTSASRNYIEVNKVGNY